MMPTDKWVMKLNERIAMRGTLIFGTMWVTYLFFIYGFLPILFPDHMSNFLYWSNTVQLWSLPLLMVGTNLLGRTSEKRSKETHDAVMRELKEIKEEHRILKTILREVCK
jgi:hypothetical protein